MIDCSIGRSASTEELETTGGADEPGSTSNVLGDFDGEKIEKCSSKDISSVGELAGGVAVRVELSLNVCVE